MQEPGRVPRKLLAYRERKRYKRRLTDGWQQKLPQLKELPERKGNVKILNEALHTFVQHLIILS